MICGEPFGLRCRAMLVFINYGHGKLVHATAIYSDVALDDCTPISQKNSHFRFYSLGKLVRDIFLIIAVG